MKFKIIISKTETEVVEADSLILSDDHILIVKGNSIVGILPNSVLVIPIK